MPRRLAAVRAKPVRLVAGLMTGTSMDGLDIAVCRVPCGVPRSFDLVAHASAPFPAELRDGLAAQGGLSVAAAARLGRELGRWYAQATADLVARHDIQLDLVGLHGQTVHHEHGITTVQLGEPAFLAAALGCPVVADFRTNDIAAGGCGAPLVPAVDAWLFGRPEAGVLTLNIGGISNITALLPESAGEPRVLGFDCGPGNMVLDELARRFTGGREGCDRDGRWARQGRVGNRLLHELLDHPFLAKAPPRSAGREEFGAHYVDHLLRSALPQVAADWHDLFATAAELTARAIADAVAVHVRPRAAPVQVIVSGGGACNPYLMERLALLLSPAELVASDALGVPSALKEAIAFALLASARIDEVPGNVPVVTGAARPVLLGKITEV